MSVAVMLHNVRSAHNVGSIFRTCDAAGARTVFLTGYTPCPRDRWGRAQKNVAKTALGAETFVSWEYRRDPGRLIRSLKSDGWDIVGVEQDARSIPYAKLKPKKKTVFLFGNEVRGLSRALRALCGTLVEIPMRGRKESLNVSVAVGIVLFACTSR